MAAPGLHLAVQWCYLAVVNGVEQAQLRAKERRGGCIVQQSDRPARTDPAPVRPVVRKAGLALGPELLIEVRRYLMMRPVVFGGLVLALLLHWFVPGAFDIATILLLAALYLLVVGAGGLEAARLSGAGDRRQERLADDALRRAGRLQSQLEPTSATDEVYARIASPGAGPSQVAIKAGNEVEDALRAVYRHYAEAERVAASTNGADLPLTFMVQELIWRALLEPNIYDTAEPILALRDLALTPRTQIQPQVAHDAARAAQSVVLRIQSLGIEIHPKRQPLAWLRGESTTETDQAPPPAELPAPSDEHDLVPEDAGADAGDSAPTRLQAVARQRLAQAEPLDGIVVDDEPLDGAQEAEGTAREARRREIRPLQLSAEPTDTSAP